MPIATLDWPSNLMPCGAPQPHGAASATIASALHPSFAYVETDATRLRRWRRSRRWHRVRDQDRRHRRQGRYVRGEVHAEVVGQTLEALRKSGDQHPFARVRALPDGSERAKEEWMTLAAGRPAASQAGPEPARPPHLDGCEKQMIVRK